MSNCTGRFAEAWEYVSFWCQSDILTGFHAGTGPDDAALSDPYANFPGNGIVANRGMVLYNLTAGTNGEVTAVTTTTLTATGVVWDPDDEYRIVALNRNAIARIEMQLDIAAANIHAALHATGACDCTLASWAAEFFKKLNIIEAGVLQRCPCQRTLDPSSQSQLLDFMLGQLEMIRTGKLEPCAGETGAEWPATGWAEQGTTEFNVGQIIANYELRSDE